MTMQLQGSKKRQRKLRKQPSLRRMERASLISLPRLQVPRTARARRRRNHRRVRVPTAALKAIVLSSRWVSLLLLALSVGALALIGMDEDFYLTMIPVEGVASIPPAEIVNASGLAGSHIFSVEPRTAAQQIADLPGVISATVTLEWPNQAHIRIQEESPVAVWQQGGQKYWINEDGDLVPSRLEVPGLLRITVEGVESAELPPEAPATTPETEGAEETEATESGPLFVPKDVLQGALLLRELRPNIDALYYDASGGLSYQDGRGWRAYFGTGSDMAQKLAVYETLVEHLEEQEVAPVYISVSNQETPYYLAR